MKLYICGVDWQHEIGEAHDLEGKMPFYSTIKELKRDRRCWKECGILEVEVKEVKWRVKQDLLRAIRKRRKK